MGFEHQALTWSDHRRPFRSTVREELRRLRLLLRRQLLQLDLIFSDQEWMAYGAWKRWALRPLALTHSVSSMAASQTLFQSRSRTFHLLLSLGCKVRMKFFRVEKLSNLHSRSVFFIARRPPSTSSQRRNQCSSCARTPPN